MKKEFDYYIFIDYSENLIGYNIIEKNKIRELLPKISKFRHYREAKNRKLYLKYIKTTINREKIIDLLLKVKIRNINKNIELYAEVLEFIKCHNNCIIFVSIDDKQYLSFEKFINIIDGDNIEIKKENELKKNSPEYRLSLLLDNLLNIERLKHIQNNKN